MKQKTIKFGTLDRERVIDEVQEHYDVKLKKVGPHPKWLQDESGRNWWILGGTGDWHGIPEEMMEDEQQARVEGMLVIAQRKLTHIEAFAGLLGPLVSARDKLSWAQSRAYQFWVKMSGAHLQCVQAPDVVLERFARIPYSVKDEELEKTVATMSMDEFTTRLKDATTDELEKLIEAWKAVRDRIKLKNL
jgi:hypothetical protein